MLGLVNKRVVVLIPVITSGLKIVITTILLKIREKDYKYAVFCSLHRCGFNHLKMRFKKESFCSRNVVRMLVLY